MRFRVNRNDAPSRKQIDMTLDPEFSWPDQDTLESLFPGKIVLDKGGRS